MSGTYEITDGWLVLSSPLGENRVRLGIANPRKLGAKLMRNLCTKAARERSTDVAQPSSSQSISDRARQLVDTQRGKITALESNDPERVKEDRMLGQMIETSRAIDTVGVLLNPQCASETPDANSTALPVSSDGSVSDE